MPGDWRHRLEFPERSQVNTVKSTYTESLKRWSFTRQVLTIIGPNTQTVQLRLQVPNAGVLLRRVSDAGLDPGTFGIVHPMQRAEVSVNDRRIGWWQSFNGFNPFERWEDSDIPLPMHLTQQENINVTVVVPTGAIWTVSEYSVRCMVEQPS